MASRLDFAVILALVAGALLLLPRLSPAGGPALPKPIRLGQPAPVPKLPGHPSRPSIAASVLWSSMFAASVT